MGFTNHARRVTGPNYLDLNNPLLFCGSTKIAINSIKIAINSIQIDINVNGNLDASNGNLGPVNGNLGCMEKQQFAVIIGKLLFFPKNSVLLGFVLLSFYLINKPNEMWHVTCCPKNRSIS